MSFGAHVLASPVITFSRIIEIEIDKGSYESKSSCETPFLISDPRNGKIGDLL